MHKAFAPTRLDVIKLIGCGGTGSILAEHICRLIHGYRLKHTLRLYDGDTVTAANITRQNFYPNELGANKAAALGLRLSRQFGIEVEICERYFANDQIGYNDLVISCTDTLVSRRVIASAYPASINWIDVGNERYHGQAIFGSTHDIDELRRQYWIYDRQAYVTGLPDIAAITPQIATARKTRARAGCADMPFRQQGFCVNAAAALAAAAIVKQLLIDGIVTTPQVYFNVADAQSAGRKIDKDLFVPWRYKPKK